MLVGIHKVGYGQIFTKKYEKILSFNGIKYLWLDSSSQNFWQQVEELDLFIYRWIQFDDMHQIAKAVIPVIERYMNIPCLPDLNTCWHYDDKIRQYYILKQANLPIVESWIFWDKKKALQWADTAEFPVVFKLKNGASSMNVVKVNTKQQAKKIINIMFNRGIFPGKIPLADTTQKKDFELFKSLRKLGGKFRLFYQGENKIPYWQKHKNYVLFQKYLPNNDYDTRVVVIGERAYAFRRFNRKNDFRSSGSGNLDLNPESIDLQHVKVAFKVSKKMQFQTMAYDFLYNNKKSEFCEISYTYVDWVPHDCPGYWDSELNWHKGHHWPQYFQLIDALNLTDLKQPEINKI